MNDENVVREIIKKELEKFPNINDEYVFHEVMDFLSITDLEDSFQRREDVASVISSCLTAIGIKNTVTKESKYCFIIKRIGG